MPLQRNAFRCRGCASAIQIVRPSVSKAETQPKLHPALLSLSAIISQYFMRTKSDARFGILPKLVAPETDLNLAHAIGGGHANRAKP